MKGTYVITFQRHWRAVDGSKHKRLYTSMQPATNVNDALLRFTYKVNSKAMEFFDLKILAIVCVDTGTGAAAALSFDEEKHQWVGLPLDYTAMTSGLSNRLGLAASTPKTPPAWLTKGSTTTKPRKKSTG